MAATTSPAAEESSPTAEAEVVNTNQVSDCKSPNTLVSVVYVPNNTCISADDSATAEVIANTSAGDEEVATSCNMDTSRLSDNDVRILINNSLVKAGILSKTEHDSCLTATSDNKQEAAESSALTPHGSQSQTPSASQGSHLHINSTPFSLVGEGSGVNSPAESATSSQSSSRLSLREVRKRLREKKMAKADVTEERQNDLPRKQKKAKLKETGLPKKQKKIQSEETDAGEEPASLPRRSGRARSTSIVLDNGENDVENEETEKSKRAKRSRNVNASEGAEKDNRDGSIVRKRKGKGGRKTVDKDVVPAPILVKISSVSTDDDCQIGMFIVCLRYVYVNSYGL